MAPESVVPVQSVKVVGNTSVGDRSSTNLNLGQRLSSLSDANIASGPVAVKMLTGPLKRDESESESSCSSKQSPVIEKIKVSVPLASSNATKGRSSSWSKSSATDRCGRS